MSTILKALKKAEPKPAIVRDRIGVDGFSGGPAVNSGYSWKGWRIAGLFAVLMLGAAGIVAWNTLKTPPSPGKNGPVRHPVARQSKAGTRSAATRPDAHQRDLVKKIKTARSPAKKRTPSPPASRSRRKSLRKQPPRQVAKGPARPVKQGRPPAVKKTRRVLPKTAPPVVASPHKTRSAPSGSGNSAPWQNAPPLQSTKIKLQALAWARQPGRRMAVIDGQVLREGDDIDGYTVAKIRKKDIILQQNQQYFRLMFNR